MVPGEDPDDNKDKDQNPDPDAQDLADSADIPEESGESQKELEVKLSFLDKTQFDPDSNAGAKNKIITNVKAKSGGFIIIARNQVGNSDHSYVQAFNPGGYLYSFDDNSKSDKPLFPKESVEKFLKEIASSMKKFVDDVGAEKFGRGYVVVSSSDHIFDGKDTSLLIDKYISGYIGSGYEWVIHKFLDYASKKGMRFTGMVALYRALEQYISEAPKSDKIEYPYVDCFELAKKAKIKGYEALADFDSSSQLTYMTGARTSMTFSSKSGVSKVFVLDRESDSVDEWHLQQFILPPEIKNVTGVGMDLRGNFLLVASGAELYMVDHHDVPPQIMKSVKCDYGEIHGLIHCGEDGSLLCGDKNGSLWKIMTNLNKVESYEERIRRRKVLREMDAEDTLAEEGVDESGVIASEWKQVSDKIYEKINPKIEQAGDLKALNKVRKLLDQERGRLLAKLDNDEKVVGQIVKKAMDALIKKEAEIIRQRVNDVVERVRKVVVDVSALSMEDISEIKTRTDGIKGELMHSSIAPSLREDAQNLIDEFDEKTRDVIRGNEEKMIDGVQTVFDRVLCRLKDCDSYKDLEDWVSGPYQDFLRHLDVYRRMAPLSHTKFLTFCHDIEGKLREAKEATENNLKEKVGDKRRQMIEGLEILQEIAQDRVREFIKVFEEMIFKKSFLDAAAARVWSEESRYYASAITAIETVKQYSPETANVMMKDLRGSISNLLYGFKLAKDMRMEDEAGRHLVKFGKAVFPIWEGAPEKKESKINIELSFRVDERTKGPNMKPADYQCELIYKITDADGKVNEIPIHEDEQRKFGIYKEIYGGEEPYMPTYLTVKRAQKILAAVKTMQSKAPSELKRKHEEFRTKIDDFSKEIRGFRDKKQKIPDEVMARRRELTKEYIKFLDESGVYMWQKFERFKKIYKETKNGNGRGYVPDWSYYWVRDPETEKTLETFTKRALMELDLGEGCISLEGHAGTGKDVIVEMFCSATKRPLFPFDATKWTTEFDLSQDVSLASDDGASYTVKEDSIVVKALETPGAVLYFNEFNAMPRQAQIFLHSLFDQKRRLQLKTSSGRIVKAHPTVIICASMNPGYPGTETPQFATRRRQIPVKVDYPVFAEKDERGKLLRYGASEALRAARSVKSLEDFAENPDLSENEFIELWDMYINEGREDDPRLTPEVKFDIEVIFSLLTFGNNIREGFIRNISDKGGNAKAFRISQPFTGSEVRRVAYLLSKMDSSEKEDLSKAEGVAKSLIREIYSPYIFDADEANDLEKNLKGWTTEKPRKTP